MDCINQEVYMVMDEAPRVLPQLGAAAIACIAPLIFGFTMGYSSPAIPDLQKSESDGGLNLTDEQSSWFSSLVAVGALIGGPIAAPIVDRFGRKFTIMLCGLPFSIGWLFMVFAEDVMFLYIGRFLTGIGTGMSTISTPTYIAEISTKHFRGALGAGFQLSITVGIFLMFTLGTCLHYKWLAIIASSFSVLLVCCMLPLPESPSWLLKKKRRNEAILSLKWLRGQNYAGVEAECTDIEDNFTAQGNSIKFLDIFRSRSVYKPLLIILGTMVFQQLSGINAVIFNTESIFEGAGFENMGGVASIILSIVQMIVTFISCLIMDKAGRKTLLIISGSLMAFSCVTFSLYYFFEEKHIVNPDEWYMKVISLGSLAIYVSMFSIGWGPIPWLFMSEVLPAKARGTCSGVAAATNWTCAFLVTKFFVNLQDVIKHYGVFWLFAGINLFGVLFVVLSLVETKGKTLEEIERHVYGGSDYQPIDEEEENNETDDIR